MKSKPLTESDTTKAAVEEFLDAFTQRFAHSIRDRALFVAALTHPSAKGQPDAGAESYERLEFLGDRVLGLIIADLLLTRFPAEPEGALARRLAALVRREALAEVAREIGLDQAVILAKGELDAGEANNPAILADVCEAMIAALYLDGGLALARDFVAAHWTGRLEADPKPPQDAKTALQEWAQGRGLKLPAYRELSRTGPPHEPLFSVQVSVQGHAPAQGEGRSKRLAEQAAAERLLGRLPDRPA